MWLSRLYTVQPQEVLLTLELCKWHPLDLLQDVTYEAAFTLIPQPSLYMHSNTWSSKNSFPPLLLLARVPAEVPEGGQVRIPEEYTATPPRPTVRLLPSQVGALLSNLTMPPMGPYICPHPASPHTAHTHVHHASEVQGPRSPSSCLRLNQAGG